MDYTALAEDLLQTRTSMSQMTVERQMSKMMKGEIFLLGYLSSHNNQAYPKELSKGMKVSTARIATILNHLEEQQFITRTTDAQDNRQIIVTLTKAGMQAAQEHRAQMLDYLVKMLELLGPEDAKEYVRLQKKLLQVFRTA
ncbi:transcriptional regulator [Butyricicoccus porcorum]|uniref:MarR family winged helix-turn-helix transcriptional regulator n=1 Tax=Butyricicoccus porcorum TaxID=1945634 RepID=UPI002353C49D|nr:transcriptional regulator [Butyricicoccus porcorum]MDD6986678.1 transcriptional regulator [Butyricicoccus porcorum]MDY4482474.1 transcriptional regulator [Butyricicoccus porcorum]